MTQPGNPVFLVAQLPPGRGSDGCRQVLGLLAEQAGGAVRANAAADAVECLEPGTPHRALFIAEFDSEALLDQVWEKPQCSDALAALERAEDALIVAIEGLPTAGLPEAPEIPTTASVSVPADAGPRHYMLIQGTGRDQERMDRYRDIILPMMKDLSSYYTVFDIEGHLRVLHGRWDHVIFAISRWPDYQAGHAFWDSERYQNTAVPIRTGVGTFLVHFAPGLSG